MGMIVGFSEDTIVLSNQNCIRFIFMGVEIVIFGQSKNGEFSKKRHKTLILIVASQILS